ADLPPLAVPGRQGLLERLRLLWLRGIAGHGVEAPDLLARVRVVGRHVSAYPELGAAVADDHLAVDDPRRAGDGVRARLVDGDDRPDRRAGLLVERHEPAVEHADVDAALVEGDPAVHHVAAGLLRDQLVDLRVVLPELLARARVDGEHHAPRAGEEE